MINSTLPVFIIVMVLMILSILYIVLGLFLSEYTIDDLLMFILANTVSKMDIIYWRYSLIIDCIQIFLAFFMPINLILIPILWIIKYIIKKKRGN